MSRGLGSRQTVIGLIALTGAAFVLRLWGAGYAPSYDELFHVLAARSWLDHGTFCIASCLEPYDRAAPFTLLVAGAFSLFGESVLAARVPSIVAGTLLVLFVFLWLRREVSTTAAWIGAGLCAVAPELIGWSQTARFYELQALLIWCGAALFYLAVEDRSRGRRAAALVGSMTCFALGGTLQVTTAIPVAALGLWLGGWLLAHPTRVPRRTLLGIATIGVIAAAILLYWQWPTVDIYWQLYRNSANLIHLGNQDNVFFYHSWFSGMYPVLYALFPLAVVLAVARHPGPAAFLTTVFVVAFVTHSFGGFKGDRLILYAFPFYFSIWGIALADIAPALAASIQVGVDRLPRLSASRWTRLGTTTAVVGSLAFAALNSEAFQTTIRLVTVDDEDWWSAPWYRGNTDWGAIRPELGTLADSVDVIVSSSVLRTLYYFDRTDFSLSRTELFHPVEGTFEPDFWRDWRTGLPVISTPQSVELIVSCYPSGLILAEAGQWRRPAVVLPETADEIERLTTKIDLPRGSRARAFFWRHEVSGSGADCSVTRAPGAMVSGAGDAISRKGVEPNAESVSP